MTADQGGLVEAYDAAFIGLQKSRESFSGRIQAREVGVIISVSTGIARVSDRKSVV